MDRGVYTLEEIQSQPEAWLAAAEVIDRQVKAIQAVFNPEECSQVIFTGCGSTYYLALAAAAGFQALSGETARALPASELWLNPRSSYPSRGKTLLVAVSRSGETTETLRACQAFLDADRGTLVTLSCYPEMPLAKMGALNLVFPSGMERSVAQTRAFSTLYLAANAASAAWAGRQDLLEHFSALPAVERRVLAQAGEPARRYGQNMEIDRFYFLGSGARYGLACELSLKMKEMSLSHSEPFHFLEFRHGPKSMVTPGTLVVGLLSESNAAPEQAVLQDVQALGGRVWTIGESGTDIHFDSGLDEDLRGPLYLAAGQMLAFERAIARGLNPDRPHNLTTVVKL